MDPGSTPPALGSLHTRGRGPLLSRAGAEGGVGGAVDRIAPCAKAAAAARLSPAGTHVYSARSVASTRGVCTALGTNPTRLSAQSPTAAAAAPLNFRARSGPHPEVEPLVATTARPCVR